MRTFTVGKLRRLIENLADDVPVLHPESDHSYGETEARVEEVSYSPSYSVWSEYYGDPEELEPDDVVTKALIIA